MGLAYELRRRGTGNKSHRKKLCGHFAMLVYFFLGVVAGTVACNLLAGAAILVTLIPLGVILAALVRVDLTTERELLSKKPAGH